MLRYMIVCALVGMSFAMRADRNAVGQALKQRQNASSGVDSEKAAKCCCKDEACSRPLDTDGVQRYQLHLGGKDWCCKSLSRCDWFGGYNDPIEKAVDFDLSRDFDLSTCEMKVSGCPAGNCPYGERAIVGTTQQTGDSQVCGCACTNEDYGSPGCDHCNHGYGPQYPVCEKECSQWDLYGRTQSCNGHGTAAGYGSDCTCNCEAGWMPEHKCKFKALEGSECVRKSYVLYAELSDFVNDGRLDHDQAERLARLYCRKTKNHAESFMCLGDTTSQRLKTGMNRIAATISATDQCIAKLR